MADTTPAFAITDGTLTEYIFVSAGIYFLHISRRRWFRRAKTCRDDWGFLCLK